jgi:hypothetical protein
LICCPLCLDQHVDKPTHTSGHTLDLIIKRDSDTLIPTRLLTDYLFSDHITVICDLTIGRIPPTEKQVSYGKIKAIDKRRLREELLLSDLYLNRPDTLNELVKCYNDTLAQTLNRHRHPYVRRSSNLDHSLPGSMMIIKLQGERKAERKWRRTGHTEDMTNYKITKNNTNKLMNEARRQFYKNFIEANNSNQHKLFAALKKTKKFKKLGLGVSG